MEGGGVAIFTGSIGLAALARERFDLFGPNSLKLASVCLGCRSQLAGDSVSKANPTKDQSNPIGYFGPGKRLRRQFLQIANKQAGMVRRCRFENVAELAPRIFNRDRGFDLY
jgi:hypothetical protein